MKTISATTQRKLETYDWPGNIREMKNNTERAVLFAGDADALGIEHFFPPEMPTHTGVSPAINGNRTIAEIEKQAILMTLESTGQNRTQAARILDISVKTLRNKLKQYGLEASISTQTASS